MPMFDGANVRAGEKKPARAFTRAGHLFE